MYAVQYSFVSAGILNGLPHNVHLHGHTFDVLKVGYANYDEQSGMFLSGNPDIECLDEFCNDAKWKNSSWSNGHVPDISMRPPKKDTVLVPIGG